MLATRLVDWNYGRPAAGIPVLLEKEEENGWTGITQGVTGSDGYVVGPDHDKLLLSRGFYRITCNTDAYFAALGAESFYGEITLTFTVPGRAESAEQTLAVAPYGYVSFTARKVTE